MDKFDLPFEDVQTMNVGEWIIRHIFCDSGICAKSISDDTVVIICSSCNQVYYLANEEEVDDTEKPCGTGLQTGYDN
jgi:hypothetical protein